jgi:hypothetical protein
MTARRNPDGSLVIGGERYRLEERGDRFLLVRVRDGLPIGGFRIDSVARSPEIDAPRESRAVVAAAAKLLASPRGLLPLQ